MPTSRRIFFILPLAALAIAGLCTYKLSRPSEQEEPHQPAVVVKRAPLFELSDHSKPPQSVRLERYIGRHRIVLVFADLKAGLAGDPVLIWLREHADAIRREDAKIAVISSLLPQDHRRMLKESLEEGEPAPFQMFSDLNGDVHRLYGVADSNTSKVSTTVFLIDRAGNLAWSQNKPVSLGDPIHDLKTEFGIE